jgi:hypothetical protein
MTELEKRLSEPGQQIRAGLVVFQEKKYCNQMSLKINQCNWGGSFFGKSNLAGRP